MPVDVWSNEGAEVNIRAVLGKMLLFPVYLEGDYSASTFTGSWRTIDEGELVELAVEAPDFPVTPEGMDPATDWTLILFKYDALSIGQPQEEGALYRFGLEMDGAPLLHGRLEVVADS